MFNFEPPGFPIDIRFCFPFIWETDVSCSGPGMGKLCECHVPVIEVIYIILIHSLHNCAVTRWFCDPFWYTISHLDLLQGRGHPIQEPFSDQCRQCLTPSRLFSALHWLRVYKHRLVCVSILIFCKLSKGSSRFEV